MSEPEQTSIVLPGRGAVLGLILGALAVASALSPFVIVPMLRNSGGTNAAAATTVAPQVPPQVLRKTTASLKEDTISIGLGKPGQRAATDYLVRLNAGDAIAYSWTATAPVSFELHGHNVTSANAPGDQSTYFAARTATTDNGYLVAPADGFYGWYFRPSTGSVDIALSLAGFYLLEPGLFAVP